MLNHCVVLHAIDATPAARNDLVKNCRVHPTHWLISTQMQTVADEAGHRDAAVLDLGVAQPADGVLVAATPEIGVGEAERVVEADDRVQLDGEGLEVRLGLLDLDGSAGRGRRHEGGRDGQASESDGELLRWGFDGDFFARGVRGAVCDIWVRRVWSNGWKVVQWLARGGAGAVEACRSPRLWQRWRAAAGRGSRLFFRTVSDDRPASVSRAEHFAPPPSQRLRGA